MRALGEDCVMEVSYFHNHLENQFKRLSSAHSVDSFSSRGQESITDENGAIFLDSHS